VREPMAAELKRSPGTYYAALDAGHRARRSRGTSCPFVHQLWWRVLVAGAALWRIARRPYALDRVGIEQSGTVDAGTCPEPPVIYAGQSIAIRALEQFVHLAGVTPSDLVLVRIELPDDYSAERPALASLPSDWDAVPAGPGSMQFGTQWLRPIERSSCMSPPLGPRRGECCPQSESSGICRCRNEN